MRAGASSFMGQVANPAADAAYRSAQLAITLGHMRVQTLRPIDACFACQSGLHTAFITKSALRQKQTLLNHR